MGREIRRVPKGWEHPKDENGHYFCMHDECYEDAAENWLKECIAWVEKPTTDKNKKKCPYYWDWDGGPPGKECYRPKFESEACCFQIYENVTEGTPFSPVFETEEQMKSWLLKEGYSEKAADNFIESGFSFSFAIGPEGVKSDIEMCSDWNSEDKNV